MRTGILTLALAAAAASSFASITVVSTTVNATNPTSGLASVHTFDSGAYGIGAGSLTALLNVERHDIYGPAVKVTNDIAFDQYDVKFYSTTPLLVNLVTLGTPDLRVVNSGANVGTSGMSSQTSVGAALYQNGGTPVAYTVEGAGVGTYGYADFPSGGSSSSSFIIAPYVNYDFITYALSQVWLDGSNLYKSSGFSIEGGGPSGHLPVTGQLHYQALPEPASMASLAVGAIALMRRRRNRS